MNNPSLVAKGPWRLGVSIGAFTLLTALAIVGCQTRVDTVGSYPATNKADCLPDVTLVDQSGHSLSLASLKGKPVLVDFVYTSCQGPCPVLTSKFALIAKRLGPELGNKVRIVSVTLDPEHDNPAQLLKYARSQEANESGWLFMTGSPAQIDQVLALYRLRRQREADGSVTHMVSSFLLGPDGHQVRLYNGLEVKPETVVADIHQVLKPG